MTPFALDELAAAEPDGEAQRVYHDGAEDAADDSDQLIEFDLTPDADSPQRERRRDASFIVSLSVAGLLHAALIVAGVVFVLGRSANDGSREGSGVSGPQAVDVRESSDPLTETVPAVLFPPPAEAASPRLTEVFPDVPDSDVRPPAITQPTLPVSEPIALGMSSPTPEAPVKPRPTTNPAAGADAVATAAIPDREATPTGSPSVGTTPTTAPTPSPASGAGTAAPPASALADAPPRPSGGAGRRGRNGIDERGLPIPDYPPESRRRGEQGTVVVEVDVRADGSVADIAVVADAGYPRLARAAVAAARESTFDPATRGGIATAAKLKIPYQFTLRSK